MIEDHLTIHAVLGRPHPVNTMISFPRRVETLEKSVIVSFPRNTAQYMDQ